MRWIQERVRRVGQPVEILRKRGPWCGLLLLGVGAGIDDGAVEDWGGEAGDGSDVEVYEGRVAGGRRVAGGGSQVKDDDFVVALAEPGAGDVEGLLRADVPETTDGATVDPEGAFG